MVGDGGREHALAWAVAKSPDVRVVYCGGVVTQYQDKVSVRDTLEGGGGGSKFRPPTLNLFALQHIINIIVSYFYAETESDNIFYSALAAVEMETRHRVEWVRDDPVTALSFRTTVTALPSLHTMDDRLSQAHVYRTANPFCCLLCTAWWVNTCPL